MPILSGFVEGSLAAFNGVRDRPYKFGVDPLQSIISRGGQSIQASHVETK